MKLPATLLKSLAFTVGSLGAAGCNVNLSNPESEPVTNAPAPTKPTSSGLEQAPPPRAVEGRVDGCCTTDPIDVLLVPNGTKPNVKVPRDPCPACGRG